MATDSGTLKTLFVQWSGTSEGRSRHSLPGKALRNRCTVRSAVLSESSGRRPARRLADSWRVNLEPLFFRGLEHRKGDGSHNLPSEALRGRDTSRPGGLFRSSGRP